MGKTGKVLHISALTVTVGLLIVALAVSLAIDRQLDAIDRSITEINRSLESHNAKLRSAISSSQTRKRP